jgi:hypothetical protein
MAILARHFLGKNEGNRKTSVKTGCILTDSNLEPTETIRCHFEVFLKFKFIVRHILSYLQLYPTL